MKKGNIAIITSGFLPVPASKGGAVENLIVNTLDQNEKKCNMFFSVFSIFDEKAKEISKKYNNSSFIFCKCPKIINYFDYIIYCFTKNILKKKNSQSYRNIFRRLYYLNFVSKKLKNENFDLILLENHPTQYLALKLRKNYIKYAGRYIYHCHNEFPGYFGCKEIIEKTKMIISVSEFINNKMKMTINSDSCRFEVLRNGIDSYKFNTPLTVKEKIELRRKYNISISDIVFIYTGRIVPEKGVLEIIKALQLIKSKVNFKLIIVGAPLNALSTKTKYQEKIEYEIQKLQDKVIFTGFINYEDMPKMYKISDVAILPSIWDDPAPLSIIESLCCGLPIITTYSGGITEYANEKCAIFNERNNNLIQNLAISIEKILNDEKSRITMSNEAYKVSRDLTVDRYYDDFIKLLESVFEQI